MPYAATGDLPLGPPEVQQAVMEMAAIGPHRVCAVPQAVKDHPGNIEERHDQDEQGRGDLRAADDRDDRQRIAEEHRPAIAHDDARRVPVERQEAEHRRAERQRQERDRELRVAGRAEVGVDERAPRWR